MTSARADLLSLCDRHSEHIIDGWHVGIQRLAVFADTPKDETRDNVQRCFAAFVQRLRGEGDAQLRLFAERLAARRFESEFEIDGPIAAAARFRHGVAAAGAADGTPITGAMWDVVQDELDAFNSGFSSAFAALVVRRSENRLRELFEEAKDILLRVDENGHIVEVNRRVEEALGHPCEAWRGAPWVNLACEHDRAPLPGMLRRILAGEVIDEHVLDLLAADGSEVRFALSGHASHSGDNKSVVVIFRDISGEQALRAQVIHAEKLASIGQLAASTAHELNNPLTWVYGNIEQSIDELGPPRSVVGQEAQDQVRQMLDEALTGVRRMAAIVRDLRTYAGGPDDEQQEFDLPGVLDLALRIAGTEVRGRARLERDFGATPRITGNPGRLSQVIVNLLVNAAQAEPLDRPASEHIVRITTRHVVGEDGGEVVIEVADDGPGVPEAVRARVFDAFVTTKGAQGTGLGLWVGRNIVEQHGGRLDLEVVDGWTRFIVRLPVRPLARRSDAAQPPVGDIRSPALILLVDDEAAILRALDRRFQRQGFRTLLAEDGANGLAHVEQYGDEIDAIVCDLGMPRMDGRELYARLREDWPDLANRLLFLSGAPDWERGETPRPCFDKPLGIDALTTELQQIAERRKSARDATAGRGLTNPAART